MAPVFFPFTHVPPSAAALLGALFPRTVVYQPLSETVSADLKALADAGRFDIRIPVTSDNDALLGLLAEYQRWAGLHGGKDLKHFKARGGRVPFFDDTSAHRLSTDIRQRAAGTPEASPPDPVFDARVFLAVAQEFDSRQWELKNGLTAYRTMEQQFLKDLKGEPDIPGIGLGGGPELHVEDPGGHMTEKRIEAFARLAREDEADDRVFVTTSRAVRDAVLTAVADAAEVLRIEEMPLPGAEALPALQQALSAHMDALLEDPSRHPEATRFPASGGTSGNRVSVCLHRLAMERKAFLDLLAALDPGADPAPKPGPDGAAAGILVGLIEGAREGVF